MTQPYKDKFYDKFWIGFDAFVTMFVFVVVIGNLFYGQIPFHHLVEISKDNWFWPQAIFNVFQVLVLFSCIFKTLRRLKDAIIHKVGK